MHRALHRRGLADPEDQKPKFIAFGLQGMQLRKYATFSFFFFFVPFSCLPGPASACGYLLFHHNPC